MPITVVELIEISGLGLLALAMGLSALRGRRAGLKETA